MPVFGYIAIILAKTILIYSIYRHKPSFWVRFYGIFYILDYLFHLFFKLVKIFSFSVLSIYNFDTDFFLVIFLFIFFLSYLFNSVLFCFQCGF